MSLSSTRILICLSDEAIASTVVEYVRLRGYTPHLVQTLSVDELWLQAHALIVDGPRLATHDGQAALPSALITLGDAPADALLKTVRHHQSLSLPVRLSDLGKTLSRLLHAVSTTRTLPLASGLSFLPEERILEHKETARSCELTEKEAALLQALFAGGGGVTREDLLSQVWNYQAGVDTHTLETHIYRLRQKIVDTGGDEKTILTTPEGYRLSSLTSA